MSNPFRRAAESKDETEVYKPSRATRLFIIWRKLRKSKLAVIGFAIVLAAALMALLAPIISPYGPSEMRRVKRPPSMFHLFGTDSAGRDMLTMIFYGARVSLYVGIVAVSLEIVIGIVVGMIAGYFGGKIDEVLMRLTDVMLTLPELPLLLVAVTFFEVRSVHMIVLVMGLLGWPYISRYVRSEFLTLRELTYVEAAKSMGAGDWRIIVRHILPNILSLVIVLATMDIPWYILYEAELTFLGFGDPLSSSWGVLLQRGYYDIIGAPWIITAPGVALFLTSLGFNLFGDGLRDALDIQTSVG